MDKTKAFASTSNYRQIFASKLGWSLFLGSKMALLVWFLLTAPMIAEPASSIVFAIALITLAYIFDYAIFRLVRSKESPLKLINNVNLLAGWYQDPWGFGVADQERYWNGEEWSESIRSSTKS